MRYDYILVYKNIEKGYSATDPEDWSTFEFPKGREKPSLETVNQWCSEYYKSLCKDEAKRRIAAYDWINDESTTPKLLNKQDFYDYRSKLRLLILNPVENPVWPEIPKEVWGNE